MRERENWETVFIFSWFWSKVCHFVDYMIYSSILRPSHTMLHKEKKRYVHLMQHNSHDTESNQIKSKRVMCVIFNFVRRLPLMIRFFLAWNTSRTCYSANSILDMCRSMKKSWIDKIWWKKTHHFKDHLKLEHLILKMGNAKNHKNESN